MVKVNFPEFGKYNVIGQAWERNIVSVEQAFVGSDEKWAPLKTPTWEATQMSTHKDKYNVCCT